MTPEDINKTAWEVWARASLMSLCADQVAILAAALVAERERCISKALGEKLEEPTDDADRAYDIAIDHVVEAIRNPQTP